MCGQSKTEGDKFALGNKIVISNADDDEGYEDGDKGIIIRADGDGVPLVSFTSGSRINQEDYVADREMSLDESGEGVGVISLVVEGVTTYLKLKRSYNGESVSVIETDAQGKHNETGHLVQFHTDGTVQREVFIDSATPWALTDNAQLKQRKV